MKKHTVYLSDLNYVRMGQEWTIIPFPLNVAYLAAYLHKMRPGELDIRIFKNPAALLEELSQKPPDIAAFSNYVWNKNLQLQFARHVKALHPRCITIMGGPNYNATERPWLERFVRDTPQIDFHIDGEGEVKFYNIVSCILEHGFDADAVKRARPAGVTFIAPDTQEFVSSPLAAAGCWARLDGLRLDMRAGRLLDLNDIPSPYLTGLLDEFLEDPNYCPIIETNRGCPYACTFCNWGDMGKSRSAQFANDRVEAELRYIAEKNVSRTPYLYIGDANFGMFERDVEFAKLLRDLKKTVGFPQNVYLYFAKNSSEKVLRIAEILKDMTRINLSRQTQNPDVLKIIKRSNISIDTFSRLASLAKSLGVESFVELIYGLPGESKASFYAGLKEVMRQRVDGIHLFPAMLLDGSEMGSLASRAQYGLKGEFRRIDGCAEQYGPVAAMEFEEIITESKAMSRADYFEIRLFHLFQVLFLDTKLYRDTETLIGDRLLFDLIVDLIEHRSEAPAQLRTLMDEFMAAAAAELLETPPQTITAADVEQARAGLVKLNPLFICKLLYDPGVRQAFNAFLKTRILAMGDAGEEDVDNVLRYIDESIYPFDGSEQKHVTMMFDAVGFSARHYAHDVKAADYSLTGRRLIRYRKNFTYQHFIDEMPLNLPLSAKVYEVLLHHTHEILRKTVSWSIEGEGKDSARAVGSVDPAAPMHDERRQIENEGGWLY
jgi:radical SAM superfamily enzyme YgiQ (UPF0313 family)